MCPPGRKEFPYERACPPFRRHHGPKEQEFPISTRLLGAFAVRPSEQDRPSIPCATSAFLPRWQAKDSSLLFGRQFLFQLDADFPFRDVSGRNPSIFAECAPLRCPGPFSATFRKPGRLGIADNPTSPPPFKREDAERKNLSPRSCSPPLTSGANSSLRADLDVGKALVRPRECAPWWTKEALRALVRSARFAGSAKDSVPRKTNRTSYEIRFLSRELC